MKVLNNFLYLILSFLLLISCNDDSLPEDNVVKHDIPFENDFLKIEVINDSAPDFIRHLCFHDSLNGLCGTHHGEIYITSDGGKNWLKTYTPYNDQQRFGEFLFIDRNIGFVVSYNTGIFRGLVLKTIDGGKTWKEVYENDNNCESICKDENNIIYIILDNKISNYENFSTVVYTNDLGENWYELGTSFELVPNKLRNKNGVFYAAGQIRKEKNTSGGLYISYDSCKSWRQIIFDNSIYVNDIKFRNNKTYTLVNRQKIYQSSDNFKNYEVLNGQQNITNKISLHGDDGIVLWGEGHIEGECFPDIYAGVCYSKDAGVTWMNLVFRGLTFAEVCFYSDNYGYVAGMENTFYKVQLK
jgi:hypothetical protein